MRVFGLVWYDERLREGRSSAPGRGQCRESPSFNEELGIVIRKLSFVIETFQNGRECLPQNMRAAKRVLDFDELYTAPAAGYRDAAHYYAEASAGPRVKNIKTPTLILISRDDPMIPFNLFEQLEVSSSVDLHVTDRGGHLGFYGTNGVDADRYWMDWRLLEWLFES